MPNFDPNAYFTQRSAAAQAKIDSIEQARVEKLAELDAEHKKYEAQKAIYNESWVGKLGLEPGSFLANRVNDAASLVSGASRLVGEVGSLPNSLQSLGERADLTETDIQAYNRYVTGKTVAGDNEILNRNVNGQTAFTKIKQSEAQRDAARGISKQFDLAPIVEQTNRNALTDQLGKGYDAAMTDINAGNVVKGVAGLLVNAGSAVLSNPAGVREFVLENAPQLVVGTAGKAGQAAMAASNVGYAADIYQQGMENYAKANGGQLPPEGERTRMALEAASLALAEQAGDMISLGAAKTAKAGVKSANPIVNTLKAAAEGVLSEAPTEGYQTWAEGDITGKPATGKDIYTSAVIGGASGGHLTGGLRAVAEIAGATPEKQAERAAEAKKTKDLVDAVESGDVAHLTDPKSEGYAPDKAVAALFAHANKVGTPEAKEENFQKAAKVVDELTTRRNELKDRLGRVTKAGLEKEVADAQAALDAADPANTEMTSLLKTILSGSQAMLDRFDPVKAAQVEKSLNEQIAQLDNHITSSQQSLNVFHKANQSTELDTAVEAQKITATDHAASQAAATNIINLSMAIPERLDSALAESLATDTTNGLTDDQRAYFRSFSAARAQENSLQKMGDVSKQVYFGKPANPANDTPRMLGIKDYRNEVGTALASGNQKQAKSYLGYLKSFVADHGQKAAMAKEAYAAFKADGIPRRLVSDGNGGWSVLEGLWESKDARLKNGGLDINEKSAKIPGEIQTESDALNAVQDELTAAYNIKFGGSNVKNVSQPAANETKAEQPETEAKKETGTDEGSRDRQPAKVASVQSDEGSGVAKSTEEAPASSAKSEKNSQTTPDQLQSTEKSNTDSQVRANPGESQEGTSTAEADATPKTGELAATQQKAEEGSSYEKLKFGDLFVQKLGDEEGSTRPLVKVKNFITALINGTTKVTDFLKGQDELTTTQGLLVQALKDRVEQWSPKITANLRPSHNEFFNHEDPIRYLIGAWEGEGKAQDVEENVKTAMVAAVFSYVADQASRVRTNGPEAINKILHRQADTPVDPLAFKMLGKAGIYQHILADTLGGRVLEALGIAGNRTVAGQDLEAKLRVSLGAHVLQLMTDVGLVETTSYTNEEMAKLSDKITGFGTNVGHVFFRIKEDADRNLVGEGKAIHTVMRGTESLLNRLFGMEEPVKFAYLAPSTDVQEKTKAGMGIPKFLKELVFGQKAKEPYTINAKPYGVLAQFEEHQAHEIFGVEEITSDNTHADDRLSKEAKNDGLKREYSLFSEFIGEYLATSKDVLKTPFYLGFNVWNQQRVGVDTSAVNPQGSKIVRWLIAAPSWDVSIKTADKTKMQTFLLKAAEGFGIKPEKGASSKAIDKLKAMMLEPLMADGMKAMQKAIKNQELTDAEKQHILNAVAMGKQKAHTFVAMSAYAEYLNAMEEDKTEFTTNLMGEVDGVSNGTILNHVLYGAAQSAQALNQMLESGGIYALGSKFKQYNLWRGTPGNLDTYEAAAEKTAKEVLKGNKEHAILVAALWKTGGPLLDATGSVDSDGRNLMKVGINPLNYGSGIKSIVAKVSGQYLETIRGKLAKMSSDEATQFEVDEYIKSLNLVLAAANVEQLKVGLPIKDYMGYNKPTFTQEQIDGLKEVYGAVMGDTMTEVIGEKFKPLMSATKMGIKQSNVMFKMYEALYTVERNKVLDTILKNKAGQPIRDLTAAEEQNIQKKLQDVLPVLNTAMSEDERNVDAGVIMMDREKTTSNLPMYKMEVRFGGETKQMTMKAQGVVPSGPSVSFVANTTQSTDSRISHLTQVGRQVFNMHDALGDGVGTLDQTAKDLNKNTFKSLLEYSPLMAAHEGLMRMIMGVVAMKHAGNLTPEMVTALQKNLADLIQDESSIPDQDLFAKQVYELYAQAIKAEKTKLDAMAQWEVVDQYTFDGGSYEVSQEDRDEAKARSEKLEVTLPFDHAELLADFTQAVYGATYGSFSEERGSTPFGDVGTSPKKKDSDPAIVALFETNKGELTVDQMHKFLQGNLTGVNRKLLELAFRTIKQGNPGLTLKLVTPDTQEGDVLAKPKMASHAWYIDNGTDAPVSYFLSPDFKDSALTAEAVLHELVHGALAQIVANPQMKEGAAELVAELELLRQKAASFVAADSKLARYAPAVADLQELLAWGMTNQGFQDNVLRKVQLDERTTKGNKFVTAMQRFVDTLTGLLFKKSPEITNGLNVLIENTSGLFAAAAEVTPVRAEINQSQAVQPEVHYTTQEVFEALDNGSVSPSFGTHLSNLLDGIVNGVYGPFGALKEALSTSVADNPMDAWLKALQTGSAAFASEIQASGFAASAQEGFVMEQVQATVATALDINDISTKPAYRELYKLYVEAKATITPADFVNAGFTEADYDFVFGVMTKDGDRSDYLSRFAAIGLANEKFNALLKFDTTTGRDHLGHSKSIFDRLVKWFEHVLAIFNAKATKTFIGQQADAKLEVLVGRLMDIQAKHQLKAEAGKNQYGKYTNALELATKGAVDAAKQKIIDLTKSPMVQNSSSGLVNWTAALAGVAAGGKSQAFMHSMRSFRDYVMDERDGIFAGLLREMKGPSELLQSMLLITKHSENARQTAIGQTSSVLLKEFEDNGKNLSKQEKSALTSVFLRTGAHNLLGTYSLPEIANMLRDPAALAQAIRDTEAQLTTVLKDQHIEQAHGLGYWKATDINASDWLMKNSYVIARMLGTTDAGKITEAQAMSQQGAIAILASLYAIHYTKSADRQAAQKVLAAENARTEGNGVELLLQVHRDMEQESLERLFNNNPILMTHGYTPEIYDPYVSIVVANSIDGKDLVEQGYEEAHSVGSDKDVPDANGNYGVRQSIYVRRDGGLVRRVSGVLSLKGEHAKGSEIHNGHTNTNTYAGTLNASMQTEVTNKKQTALNQAKNIHRDFSKTKRVSVAPIYDDNGNVVNWAHLMSGETKDTLLKRENRFEKVMGTLAGSIIDKHTGKELNEKAITALRDQFDNEAAISPWSYTEVSATSSDPDNRELWALLPADTKTAIRKIWGRDAMMVRKDSMDGVFGYRKLSASDFLTKERADLEGVQRFARGLFHSFAQSRGMGDEEADNFAKRMGMYVLQGERGWQEIYKEVKDIIVVKNLVTLVGNVYSNSSLLWLLGVKDAWKNQLVALRGIMAYEKDHRRLMELEAKLVAGYSGINSKETSNEIARLKDAIARNPVTKLVDAGLMPTIVEDVDLQEDPYSYKTGLGEKLEALTARVPEGVKTAAKTIYMAHDTPLYKVLSRATQYSDFVARYAMYQHLVENEGMEHDKAIGKSLNAFVHYDVPMQRSLQYLDDMGFTPFMKYFYRIQRVLMDTAKERPARVLGMILMNRIVDLGPIVLDSSLVSHAFNMPFRGGAMRLPAVMDELLTVQAGMALVH